MPPEFERGFTSGVEEFTGYDSTLLTGVPVIGVFDDKGGWTNELGEGQEGYIALPRTPFYLESGGQVSDQGRLFGADGSEAVVQRMVRYAPGRPRLHHVRVTSGVFRREQIVSAEVQDELRDATRRNHTATHLLHAALRQVLGSHVKQAGSLVAPDRLRFDFVHFAADSARRPARDRTDRQRADSPQHRGADGGPLDGGRDRGGGDGPVRREIRGSCPRRLRARLQPRAVRRHARQGDRRHRLLRDHRGERRRGRRAPHRGAGRERKPSSARNSSAQPSSRCRRC